jgi:poly(3-hydroxybutyrate) depolymerase
VIWVSANKSGNSMTSDQRISEATASFAFIVERYALDDQQIYIAGMSGGAQIANIVAALRPDLFNGGLVFLVFLLLANRTHKNSTDFEVCVEY